MVLTARINPCPDTNRFAEPEARRVGQPHEEASTGRSASTPPREARGGDPGAGATRAMRDSDTSRAAPPGLTSLFLLTQGLRPGLPSRRASPPQQAKPGLARGPGSGAGFGTGRPDRRLENVHARAVPHLM